MRAHGAALLRAVCLAAICIIAGAASTQDSLDACMHAFERSGYGLKNFESFPSWYTEESELLFPQSGRWVGPKAIEEYLRLLAPSPYMTETIIPDTQAKVTSYDEGSGECTLLYVALVGLQNSQLTAWPGLISVFGVSSKIFFTYDEETNSLIIRQHNFYFDPILINVLMTIIWNTDQIRSFVCDTMQNSCPDTWEGNGFTAGSHDECVARLAALPATEGELNYIHGNSQGCRILHASLVPTSPEGHCAHISFTPMEDPKGLIKCQAESVSFVPTDLFTDADVAWFQAYLEHFGISETGNALCECDALRSTTSSEGTNRRVLLFGSQAKGPPSVGPLACATICAPPTSR